MDGASPWDATAEAGSCAPHPSKQNERKRPGRTRLTRQVYQQRRSLMASVLFLFFILPYFEFLHLFLDLLLTRKDFALHFILPDLQLHGLLRARANALLHNLPAHLPLHAFEV